MGAHPRRHEACGYEFDGTLGACLAVGGYLTGLPKCLSYMQENGLLAGRYMEPRLASEPFAKLESKRITCRNA